MEDNMEANRERAIYKDKLIDYVDGTRYLCEQHKDTTHVVGAVCPICVGKERQDLIAAYLGEEARIFELEAKIKKLEAPIETTEARLDMIHSILSGGGLLEYRVDKAIRKIEQWREKES